MCDFQQVPEPQKSNVSEQEYSNDGVDMNTYVHQGGNISQTMSGGTFVSLTGESVNMNEFKHNNQVPFMGSKVTQDVGAYKANEESFLDNKTGVGSQHIKKEEIAPLFAPHESMQHTFGMPNYNDIMQTRVNPSMKHNNTKPFEEIRVGPGSARIEDTQNGFGGFNAGMIGREQWMPKNVDQLRVSNNPKESYSGRMIQ